MKTGILLILIAISFTSCTVARFTQVSTNNIDHSIKYTELKKYQKGSAFSLHSIAIFIIVGNPHIEDAISKAVRKVSGGVYMENVTVKEFEYQLILFSIKQYKAKGDVLGIPPVEGTIKKSIANANMKFDKGDNVNFTNIIGKIKSGRIIALDNNCAIIETKNLFGKVTKKKIAIEKLIKE